MSDTDGTCEYVLDPDDPETWGGEEGEECYIEQELLNENGVWRCPHTKDSDSNKCIFHKKLNNKENKKVLDKFVEKIKKSSNRERENEFIASNFGKISVENEFIEGNDIYLSYSNIDGEFDLEDVVLNCSAHLKGIRTNSKISISDSEIKGSMDFRFSRFRQDIEISSSEFHNAVDFRSSVFESGISLGESESDVKFRNELIFIGSTIEGGISCKNVQFEGETFFGYPQSGASTRTIINGNVYIVGSVFKENAYFCGISFDSDVYFSDNPPNYNNSVFESPVYFGDSIFSGIARFSGVKFKDYSFFGHPDFEGRKIIPFKDIDNSMYLQFNDQAKFKKSANFKDCVFEEESYFYNVQFEDLALFSHQRFIKNSAVFEKKAYFLGSKFEFARFSGVRFIGGAYFGTGKSGIENAVFQQEVDFSGSDFDDDTSFSEVEFGRQANFDDVSFTEVMFRRTRFERGALFRNYADSDNVCFTRKADFSQVIADDGLEFQTIEDGSHVNIDEVEFQSNTTFFNAELSNSDFRGVGFDEPPDFNQANLTGTDFSSSILRSANFENAVLSRATLHDADLRGSRLYGAVFGGVQIDDRTKFLKSSSNKDNSLIILGYIRDSSTCVYDTDFPDKQKYVSRHKAKSVYKTLEELGGKHARPRLQARSFVRRQDLQKQDYWDDATADDASLEERLIAGARWSRARVARATLLYGESPWRVIAWSLGIILFFAFSYPAVGGMKPGGGDPITYAQIVANPIEIFILIYYSTLTYTALGFGDFQPVGLGRLLTTVETGLGAVMLALLVFILGRRAAR